jgi:hypothetical protein
MPTLSLGAVAGSYYVAPPPPLTNWKATPSTIMTDVSSGHPYAIKWINNEFVIPVHVDQSSSTVKRIWANSSPASNSWTGYTLPYPDMTRPIDISYHNGTYVVVGENSSGTAKCFTSTSLSGPWTERTLSDATRIEAIFIMDGKVIIVGKTASQISYWHSTDATTYTRVALLTGSLFTNYASIAFTQRSSNILAMHLWNPSDSYKFFGFWNVTTHQNTGGGNDITTWMGGSASGTVFALGSDKNGYNYPMFTTGNTYLHNPNVATNSDWYQNSGITGTVSSGIRQLPNQHHNINVNISVGGGSVVFADNAGLKRFFNYSFQGGFSVGSMPTLSGNVPTAAMLGNHAKWGGAYAPTLGANGTWLAMAFSGSSFNSGTKYDQMVYTDNPLS